MTTVQKITGVILILQSCIIPVFAQYALGMTGLLNVPNADMQEDGLFMAGCNFLPKELTPERWNYNTGNYFLNITFLPFAEVNYRCTLFRGDIKGGNLQQDRSVSLRLRALKESRLLPSVVVGSHDVFTTNELNVFADTKSNRFFSSVYAVMTKNIRTSGDHLCGFTFGSYFFSKNDLYKGIFAGISYTPAFLKPVSFIAEYETKGINAGFTTRLFNHFTVHVFTCNFKAGSCGLRYEYLLNKRK